MARTLFFIERDKIKKRGGRIFEFEAQSATHAEVLFNRLLKSFHGVPPGQGSASDRRERRSTLA